MARPKKETFDAIKPNTFTRGVERQLKKIKKDWEYIITHTDIRREIVRSWLNGHRQPSIDNVVQVAYLIGVENPKSLIAGMEIGIINSKNTRLIVYEIAKKRGLKFEDFKGRIDVSDKTIKRILKPGYKPRFGVLQKFATFLKLRPLDLYQITLTPSQFK